MTSNPSLRLERLASKLKPVLAVATIPVLAIAACGQEAPRPGDSRPPMEILKANGLAAADKALAARPRDPGTAFLLGAVRTLRAAETMMQVRYANSVEPLAMVPGMQARLPANPDARFDPAFLETALTGALAHLAAAETALEPATRGEFSVDVELDAIWLDVNANGKREDWEGLVPLLFAANVRGNAEPEVLEKLVIRFDTADADWLAAYVHLLSGTSELVLSLDPTPALTEIFGGREKMERRARLASDPLGARDGIDLIAACLRMLDGVPDAVRTRAALDHFRSMITHNRAFWKEVMAETDNEREWLPNPDQTSAFGVQVDRELAGSWIAALEELDLLLKGERVVPYWRIADNRGLGETGVGVDVASLLSDPGDLNAVLMIQGTAFAPHLKEGRFVSLEAWSRFQQMAQGDALLFALWFN